MNFKPNCIFVEYEQYLLIGEDAHHSDLWEWDALQQVRKFPTFHYFFLFGFMHFSHLQARVALYTGGSEDFSIFFNSTNSDNINWFSETRVTDSPWTDLNTEPHYRFSIEGCCGSRDFYIVRNHGGCPEDAGWLTTTSTGCDWEKKYTETTILYSKLRTYSSFSRTGKRKLRRLVNYQFNKSTVI